jgi:hypothetical protein
MRNNLLDENLSNVCDGRAKIMAWLPAQISDSTFAWIGAFCLQVIAKSWPATVGPKLPFEGASRCAAFAVAPLSAREHVNTVEPG